MNLDKTLLHTAGIAAALLCIMLLFIFSCDRPSGQKGTSTPEVHALLILLGNDEKIQVSVEKNEAHMTDLLTQLSKHCTVHLTVMVSGRTDAGANTGRVIQQTLSNGAVSRVDQPLYGGLITKGQVTTWLEDLRAKAKPEDTVLIYYNGHGEMVEGSHHLFLNKKEADILVRAQLRAKLRQNPCRLKLLITDTCSNVASIEEPLARVSRVSKYAVDVEARQQYARNLFLQHTGLLDITAATPGQYAWSDPDIGGYFTNALARSCALEADKNQDNFLTWQEVFDAAKQETEKKFRGTDFVGKNKRDLEKRDQTTQTPFDYYIPTEDIRGPRPPRIHPPNMEIETTATLNVTSTPSGATVYLDGNRIGTTPLRHEVDTGTQGQKQAVVGLEHEGYKSHVEKVTLTARQTTPLDVPLKQTVARLDITSTPIGAEVYVDEEFVGKTPLRYSVDTGMHLKKVVTVGVELAGYKTRAREMTLSGGQTKPWDVRLIRTGPPKRITGNDGAEMALIPAGEFQMGSYNGEDHEKPVHTVYVDAFYMDVYEVTNAQFKAFVDANPEWRKDDKGIHLTRWRDNSYPSGRENHPVGNVSWYAAMAYAQWAGKRLPTEAEWEKAARGGLVGKKYPWGDTIDVNKANYGRNDTRPVGRYAPNGYGLYDMAGNVWEWCLDPYDGNFYARSQRRNPLAGEMTLREVIVNYKNVKISRVLRGGSWFTDAQFLRVADRFRSSPSLTYVTYGFRCARGTVTP